MKSIYYIFLLFISLFFTACITSPPPAVYVKASHKQIDYLNDVKPILDKRCVSCHSCYNAPCQTKFSSFEGLDRGASKELVYDAMRLSAVDPTRLFIDAKSTKEWREKGFFSITKNFDSNATHNDSIMIQMLKSKKDNPEVIGSYEPDYDELICPKNPKEMGEYLKDKPNHGMPYGFPALQNKEYTTLAQWLQQNAKGPTPKEQKLLKTPSKEVASEIQKWETFLNKTDAKHAMTARYLYEHLFLAHINFKANPNEFYTLVRSKTKAPSPIEIIPTLRPFDSPGTDTFFYRFEKIHTTIVHKTHMVLTFDDEKLARINTLFIKPKWVEKPHRVSYETTRSANAFKTFFQIPVRSRYQFLLDNNNYIIMTFIRGPVCRGQIALNVINDHFWVMFQDPNYDISVLQPGFLLEQANNLSLPIETVDKKVIKTFSDEYRDKYENYFRAKQALYDSTYPKGLGIEGIWKGNNSTDTPLLTVYRHFNSASVLPGVVGKQPRTMWVIDYPQLERIYYALVAGYDVYGNVSHQTNIRRYMDFLRMEGEVNFLTYLPLKNRLPMFKSWYIDDDDVEDLTQLYAKRDTSIKYKSDDSQSELIDMVVNDHILKSTGIAFDNINYFKSGEEIPKMPKSFHTIEDFLTGIKSLTAPGTEFIRYNTDYNINLIHLRVILPNKKSKVVTLVINRWHNNVNSLFGEEDRLDSSKDTIDVVEGFVGSYPNLFGTVHHTDLVDFFDLLSNYKDTPEYKNKLKKYFVSRSDKHFWETFDWFQNNFNNSDPINAGLYDLNRYYRKGW